MITALVALNRSKGRRGPNSPSWKGGRWVTTKGYIRLYAPDYPNAKKDGFIFEHRMVMEQTLGRPLRAGEEVHHLNGDRADNRPENLELWFVRRQPKGVRLGDVPHCPTCRCQSGE
jgi:HNH endonuclease